MNNKGIIYLSGGMEHATNLGEAWRQTCSKKLSSLGYSALDITAMDKEYTAKNGELFFGHGDCDPLQRKSNIRRHFVDTDLALIKNDADALIVLYDESVRRGAGTISECQYAYLHDIPIFIVSVYDNWYKELPGWLYALSTKCFNSFDDLYLYLDKLPDGIIKRDRYGNHSSGNHYLCSLCGDPFEKKKHHYVSKVSPTYCNCCVERITNTNETHKNRYEFFVESILNKK